MLKYLLIFLACYGVLFAGKPDLLLLKEYHDQNVTGWLMSEKLDGVRAYWDGKKLISRGGTVINAPKWFTHNFPPFEVDGELWSKRGDFDTIVSTIKQQTPNDNWKALSYNIFEVPHAKGGLLQRLTVLQTYLSTHETQYLRVIPQLTCKDTEHLKTFLQEIEQKGGEGVVVRNPQTPYIAKRDSNSLKVKNFHDAECEVIAHHKGEGKYQNLLGSLTCKAENGVTFDIGSGFSDDERTNPPSIGVKITYKYQEITKNGKPRFPVFVRVREAL